MNKMNAVFQESPERRYRDFIETAAEFGEVWLLENKDGYTTINEQDESYLLLWSEKEMAERFAESDEQAVSIEVHEFYSRFKAYLFDVRLKFLVCPTFKDSYLVRVGTLLEDLMEELVMIE